MKVSGTSTGRIHSRLTSKALAAVIVDALHDGVFLRMEHLDLAIAIAAAEIDAKAAGDY